MSETQQDDSRDGGDRGGDGGDRGGPRAAPPGRSTTVPTLELHDLVALVAVAASTASSSSASPVGRRRLEVALVVEAGELVAAVEPSDEAAGPADSTALARTVAGLAPPAAGQVLIHGIDVTARHPNDRGIRYVPAGGGLLPHLTVEQNVRYGLDRSPVVREETEARVRDAAERWELTSLLGTNPGELTHEQQLRVAVARAAVCRPEAIVADLSSVPTSPARLRDVFQDAGVAVLLCSGNPAALEAADRTAAVYLTQTAEVPRPVGRNRRFPGVPGSRWWRRSAASV